MNKKIQIITTVRIGVSAERDEDGVPFEVSEEREVTFNSFERFEKFCLNENYSVYVHDVRVGDYSIGGREWGIINYTKNEENYRLSENQ